MNGEHVETYSPPSVQTLDDNTSTASTSTSVRSEDIPGGVHTYRLEDLAYTRSGDKGNNCNIGNSFTVLKFDHVLVTMIHCSISDFCIENKTKVPFTS